MMKWGLLIGFFLMSCHPSSAQPASAKVMMVLEKAAGPVEKGFSDYLRRRGIDIEPFVVDCQASSGACELQPLLADIHQKKPALLYVSGTPLAVRLIGANLTIPLLCVGILDLKLLDSNWAMNQGTGRTVMGVIDLPTASEQIAALKSYTPIKKIGILSSSANPWVPSLIRDLQSVSEKETLEVVSVVLPLSAGKELSKAEVTKAEVTKALENMASQSVDFVYLAGDEALRHMAGVISQELERLKLASFCITQEDFQAFHPLYGFYADPYQLGQLAGMKAEAVLQKNSEKEMLYTFETLKRMITVLNLKTIKLLPHRFAPPIAFFRFAEIYTPDSPQKGVVPVESLSAPGKKS